MTTSFDTFTNQQTTNMMTNTNSFVGIRPSNWLVTLKQNAQNGRTYLNLNLRNVQSTKDEFNNLEVQSFQFVVLTAMQMATANANKVGMARVTSNVTNKGVFDLRGIDENRQSHPLGLFNGRDLRNGANAWSQLRLFGVLRAVNGHGPAKLPELKALFNDRPVPVVMDLTFDKQNELMDQLHAGHYDFNVLPGQVIQVTAGKTGAKTAVRHGRTYYLPNYDLTTLDDQARQAMDEYAKNEIQELLTFNDQVNQQDEFFSAILETGLKGLEASDLVAKLNEAGVKTAAGLKDYVADHGGWSAVTGHDQKRATATIPAGGRPMPTTQPANQPAEVANSTTEPAATESASTTNDQPMETIDTDSLPF